MESSIQIGLQLVDSVLDLLAESDLVGLLQNGLVEASADGVGLAAAGLGS